MKQTTNYQLNQWEAQDRILREDFNADNFKIEQAMAALTEAMAQQAAALQKKIDETAEANPYVKLLDTTTTAGNATVSFDVSGIDFTKYRRIDLDLYLPAVNLTAELRINNLTSYSQMYSGSGGGRSAATWLGSLSCNGSTNPMVVFHFNMPVTGRPVQCVCGNFGYGSCNISHCISTCKWEDLSSFQLVRTSGGESVIPAGTRFVLSGIKK